MTWHMYQDMGMCGCLKFVGLTALWKAIRGSYGLVDKAWSRLSEISDCRLSADSRPKIKTKVDS